MRLFAGFACFFAPALPVGGAAMMSMMMMAFMADAGLPDEAAAERAITASMSGLGLLSAVGVPTALGILMGKRLGPFLLATGAILVLGLLLWIGGFVAYYATLAW